MLARMRRGLACVFAVLLGAAVWVSAGSTANPRSVTVMTLNIYQGTELEHVLAATDPFSLVTGVATDYANVVATNFPERARALAAEIGQAQPALVGLQEVATWRTQFPSNPAVPATHVTYDFLQILLDALNARGLHYATVNVRTNFGAQAPALTPFGLMDVSLTEQTAIIARTDLPTDDLKLSNPQSGDYVAHTVFSFLGQPFSVGGGWLSVDAKVRGKSFRFITTHMDPISPLARDAQAHELLAGPASGGLPVVLVGDLNSAPDSAAYAAFVDGGLVDTWAATHPGDPGLTCCQVPPDSISDPFSKLTERVDHVFASPALPVVSDTIYGADPSDRTPSGLWPTDHAGLAATLGLLPNP